MRSVAGLLVGTVVGITGVGGGALMTPILVLMFGIAPQTAVGTDLLYASITKMFGVAVHHNHGTVDWGIVRRLAMGSLPAAAATLAWMHYGDAHQIKSGFIITAVAIALIITALGMLLKDWLHRVGRSLRVTDESYFKHLQPAATVAAGVLLGVLVTLTSIGAGALGTVMLVYLYPMRLNASKLVGTDLAHAIPLALIAGLGHLSLGNVDYGLLISLLLGSIPGVLIGSFISTRAPLTFIRYAIAIVLGAVAIKMFTV
ncbi:sulfite exporter TauE/SafE family protein [Ideonella sp.]|uniref:sulfite exporter TauE/SafE family protein n=1 Tax=Ideonella sp. TaxID=1929293 RepID=UPI002B48489B|nr:sulfite exporter TauE/SafE family protein [Ideonella sp.]HJV72572.1 sulfite exporter TauE/SafE family protein [Ideonella sp.]